MLSEAIKQIKTAVILFIIFTFLTGFIYPSIVTLVAQLLFPWQANGSLLEQNGKTIGSLLIGQSFTNPKYFSGRPSATTPYPYNAENSSGSNLGPTNPVFLSTVKDRISILKKLNPKTFDLIPVELVTASASGLDPEISPLAALYQVPRIAKARKISEKDLQILIQLFTKKCSFKILGEPRINVLQLNLALDNLTARKE